MIEGEMMGHPTASIFLTLAMGGMAVLVAVLFVLGVRRATGSPRTTALAAAGVAGLMLGQHLVAASGLLRKWELFPPPLFLVLAGTIGLTLWVCFSRLGTTLARNLSFPLLIGAQAFRLPLELIMHGAWQEGVMPVQMSYAGRNFDILTGISALLLSLLVWKGNVGRVAISLLDLIRLWNLAGFLLLLNIVGIAIASLPLFRAFGDEQVNTWIAYPIFVWLPGTLVPFALMGMFWFGENCGNKRRPAVSLWYR